MRNPDWQTEDGQIRLFCGEALELLADMSDNSVDAIITDPPYSSGGAFRGDRMRGTVDKYVRNDAIATCRDEFSGDNRDQRAFAAWCAMWCLRCHDVAVPGGVLAAFIDWRQLPTLTDAVQCGGWVWRGLGTWHKPGVRMQRGRFSASAEYVVYASRGLPNEGEDSPQNVFACAPVPGDEKTHVAEKPVEVMRWVVGLCRAGGIVLDPFMGSGTTAIACDHTDRSFVGFEKDEQTLEKAIARITEERERVALFEPVCKNVQRNLLKEETS